MPDSSGETANKNVKIGCVEDGKTPGIASAEDAYLALRTALAVIKSLESGEKEVL